PGLVQLLVYNSLGQQVSTLVNAPLAAGGHTAYWNGVSDEGFPVASGTYFIRLISDGRQIVRKMVLTK
ncbi:MAG TPA: T9SS type A sorting domain-containing protein, partial [Bacteroidetes bacterium]|nr:T9SS type A sorting domain-containing protein [Bacteroidota bacterium]